MQCVCSSITVRSKSGILAGPDIVAVDLSGSRQERTLTRLETWVFAASAAAASEPVSKLQILLIPRNSSLACLSGYILGSFEPKDGTHPLTQINQLPQRGLECLGRVIRDRVEPAENPAMSRCCRKRR
jgi:hypothetical protein